MTSKNDRVHLLLLYDSNLASFTTYEQHRLGEIYLLLLAIILNLACHPDFQLLYSSHQY